MKLFEVSLFEEHAQKLKLNLVLVLKSKAISSPGTTNNEYCKGLLTS